MWITLQLVLELLCLRLTDVISLIPRKAMPMPRLFESAQAIRLKLCGLNRLLKTKRKEKRKNKWKSTSMDRALPYPTAKPRPRPRKSCSPLWRTLGSTCPSLAWVWKLAGRKTSTSLLATNGCAIYRMHVALPSTRLTSGCRLPRLTF